VIEFLKFTCMGLLGGCAYVLMWKIKEPYEVGRHIILSAIVGTVYHLVHTEYNFPNLLMAFVSGYFCMDFLEGLVARYRKEI